MTAALAALGRMGAALVIGLLAASAASGQTVAGRVGGPTAAGGGTTGIGSGATAAPSWVNSTLAAWMLDEASGTRVNAQGDASWNLGPGATPPSNDTVNKMEGTAAGLFAGGVTEQLLTGNVGLTSPLSMGCWARQTGALAAPRIVRYYNGTPGNGVVVQYNNPTDLFEFRIYSNETTGVPTLATTPVADSVWAHVAGTHGGTTSRVYLNGALSTTNASVPALTTNPNVVFQVGTNQWTGQLDECFVAGTTFTDAAICRICSCGIRGEQCSCNGTSYVSRGRNATSCGSCTLPTNCLAATP